MSDQDEVIIKTYTGSQSEAMALYQADSADMAAQNYFPTSQSWVPGRWSGSDFLVALLLCFIFVGVLIFLYMLVVTPKGTLFVTYALRVSAEEKICPRCAEQIKAAALACRFCGYEFKTT
ncbi:MAG: zinc ribbon domain-containing protein [Alphaproteobacteria bacterium]|nr:zinc ribbon domain-containing protein [Alphaproteobacteria bacterium]